MVHVEFTKENLVHVLTIITSIINDNKTLPILANVLIETVKEEDEDRVVFSATDLRMSIQTKITAQVFKPLVITVPAKKLLQIVKEFIAETVSFSVEDETNLVIYSSQGQFKIMGLSKDEFPPISFIKEKSIELDQSRFKEALKKTLISVSADITRPVLNGVYLEVQKDHLVFVGTDGRRLSWTKISQISQATHTDMENVQKIIIPAKIANELLKNLKKEGTFNLFIGEKVVGFSIEETHYLCQLIEGNYPNFNLVIPKDLKNLISVNRELFMGTLRRSVVLIDKKLNRVKFELQKNKIIISTKNSNLGESQEVIDVSYDGDDISVGFSPLYLLDFLRTVESEEVFFGLTDSAKSGLMKVDDNFLYVIMPMRLI